MGDPRSESSTLAVVRRSSSTNRSWADSSWRIRFLSIDDYGRVVIVLNLFFFLESFAGLRLSDLLFRFFQPFREQRDPRALQGLLLACL